jgi:hypothetical protein
MATKSEDGSTPLFLSSSLPLFVGLVTYATGYFICGVFYYRIGASALTSDLLQPAYIQVGVLFWLFPLILLAPFLVKMKFGDPPGDVQQTSSQPAANSPSAPKDTAATAAANAAQAVASASSPVLHRSHISGLGIAFGSCWLFDLYLLTLFAPPGFFQHKGSGVKMAFMWFAIVVFTILVIFFALRWLQENLLRWLQDKCGVAFPNLNKLPDLIYSWRKVFLRLGICALCVFAFVFVYLLKASLGELITCHALTFSCFCLLITMFIYSSIRIGGHWLHVYRSDQERRNILAGSLVLQGLVIVLAMTAFAHSIYFYIPADRGGGDFTTMPIVQLALKSPVDSVVLSKLCPSNSVPASQPSIPTPPAGSPTLSAKPSPAPAPETVVTKQLLLIGQTHDWIFLARPDENGGPKLWRRGRIPVSQGDERGIKPNLFLVPCSSISSITFSNYSLLATNI